MSAVTTFRSEHRITTPLERVDGGCVAWRKTSAAASTGITVEGAPAGPRLAPRVETDELDLSVVVVFYNMRREAERTLHSLSRPYQEGIEDVAYEVIVVENGSDDDQKLGSDSVARFGPEFRYLDVGADAVPSPVGALNRAIAESTGRNLALMIDGAHVVTPGVLRFGLDGLRAYRPAVVTTQQWYVGPGQQGDAIDDGYDIDYEDRLFEAIDWPDDGYRLFEIGHFIGDRDWFDGVWEIELHLRPAVAARTGRRVRRELLDAGGRVREPGALRAAGAGTRRHHRDDSWARDRSTSSTVVRPPTNRTRPSGERASSVTDATTPSFAVVRTASPRSGSTTSGPCPRPPLGEPRHDDELLRRLPMRRGPRVTAHPWSRYPYPTS